MPELEILAVSSLGSLLGMRHALEPDHLAAVSTLLTDESSGRWAACLGACWGLGHTVTLVAAGVVLMTFQADMPAAMSDLFELGVVFLLLGFGARAIYLGGRMPALAHHRHVDVGSRGPAGWRLARPLVVGAVHGLAGSGALTALVVTTLPSTSAQIAYLGLFGLGSIVGMAALSGLLSWPIARWGSRPFVARGVSLTAGIISVGLGLFWGWGLAAGL